MSKSLKETLKNYAVELIHAQTEKDYFEIFDLVQGLNPVHVTDKAAIEEFQLYFDVNWHAIRPHWAFHLVKHEATKNTFTNNRTENTNMLIKLRVPKQSSLPTIIN